MKRPTVKMPRRPRSMSGAVARSRKEAAIQLVRVEFDAARLDLAIGQAEQRAEAHRQEAALLAQRRRRLLAGLR